jgi:hypothetical protein
MVLWICVGNEKVLEFLKGILWFLLFSFETIEEEAEFFPIVPSYQDKSQALSKSFVYETHRNTEMKRMRKRNGERSIDFYIDEGFFRQIFGF